MMRQFAFQITVGFLCVACVAMFGQPGFACLALYAFTPLFSGKAPDERELFLFYKTGNVTLGLMILLLVGVHFLQNATFAGLRVGDHWLVISANAMPVIQGLVGMSYLKTSE